jgi:uncharacterized protein DUF1996
LVGMLVIYGLPARRAAALRQSEAVWSTICDMTRQAKDDPIVFPGRPGASHLHDFFGNPTTDAFSTTNTLASRSGDCLKGWGDADRAAYWVPSLLRNGQPVVRSGDLFRIQAYYAVLDKPLPVEPIPYGLRMIAGDAMATSPQPRDVVHFNCLKYPWPSGGQATGPSTTIPTCGPGTYISARIQFPGCWNGRDLDSADHKSHMAYPRGGRCPSSHPVGIPTLLLRVRWQMVGGVPASQLSFSTGGQHNLHADFWNVWAPDTMRWLVDNCLNARRNCRSIGRDQVGAAATFP